MEIDPKALSPEGEEEEMQNVNPNPITNTSFGSRQFDLYWDHLTYSVPVKTTENGQQVTVRKELLREVSGKARGGRVLAIMGPSGAGKTTLMNAVSGRVHVGDGCELDGHCFLNDVLFQNKYKPIMAFVAQDDIVFENDSPREALYFSYRIRKNAPHAEAVEKVDQQLESLGLQKCADTPIGTPGLVRGVSGGERKRTNIGTELITDPRILILDEPTTGLDSVTASKVIGLLKDLAHEQNRTVLCTIHTPSSELFQMFDDVLLLARGGVVYHGSVADAPAYFASIGHPVPRRYNASDFYMKLLQMDVEEVDKLLESWRQYALTDGIDQPSIAPPQLKENSPRYKDTTLDYYKSMTGASAGLQFQLLLRRSMRNFVRNKMSTVARLGQTIFTALLLGLFFLGTEDNQVGVQDRMGFLFMFVVNSVFMAIMNGVAVFPPERAVFLLEQSNGSYSPWLFTLAKVIAELPFQIVFPILSSTITYWMVGLEKDAEAFFIYTFVAVCVTNTAQSFGLLLSAWFAKPEVAMAVVPMVVLPIMLVGGLMANTNRLDPYWIWLNKLSFVRYGYEALVNNQYTRVGLLCDPANTQQRCTFRTGGEVLVFYGFEDVKWGINIMALLIMMLGFRVLTGVALWYQGSQMRAHLAFKSFDVASSPLAQRSSKSKKALAEVEG